MTPAVFLDRDGTLLVDVGYLDRIERLELFPWSVDAVRLLNRAGFRVVIVTNQAGVARGIIDESFVHQAHQFIGQMMTAGAAKLDAYYYCPHLADAPLEAYRKTCECRKPGPGMLRQAARDLDVDLQRSFAIGDRWHDIQAGQAAGARSILVRTGYGRTEEARPRKDVRPAAVTDNLIEAVSWILANADR
jgi:D-glycero-D-manno-heptose 1,7-bisphosphate phosphatase